MMQNNFNPALLLQNLDGWSYNRIADEKSEKIV